MTGQDTNIDTENTKVRIPDANGFRFRDWDVYKDSLRLRIKLYDLIKTFPKEEMYALADQLRRAVNSVILNIAEGSNKSTDKESKVYINRAHCSLDEVVACLDCALMSHYLNADEHSNLLGEIASLAKRLRAFTIYLSNS